MECYEEPTTRLKSALDINELTNPEGKGAEFELEDDEVKKEGEIEQDTMLDCFDKNKVASQICVMTDDEEDGDDDNENNSNFDLEHLKSMPHEMEALYKRIFRIPNSDITPKNDGGVLKQIKTLGVGNIVPENSLVRIHYNAYKDVGESPYDSSRLRGDSYKLRLGRGKGLPGLELGILTMRKNEFSRFLIRYDYAFGEMGCPPRIPKKATIIMDVELLHFVEQEGVDDYYSLTHEERRLKLTFPDIEKVVRAENKEGKEYFAMKVYQKAYGKFKKSIGILDSYSCKNEAEEKESNKWKIKANVNCAICSYNLIQSGRVISFCNQALQLDSKNVKALFYKGKALHAMNELGQAEHFLKLARNVDPTNTAVSKALKALANSKRKMEAEERLMCQRMFGKTSIQDNDSESKDIPESTSEEPESQICSERFKETVQNTLQTFKDDRCLTEMKFPNIPLNPAEILCLVETAAALGLEIRSVGTGNALTHEIYKKPPK